MSYEDSSFQSSFGDKFLSINHLADPGFKELVFLPAMLFEANDKWWGEKGRRDSLHEGLDIFAYRTVEGRIQYLDDSTQFPVMYSGRVAKVIPDFLGKSVFVIHSRFVNDNRVLYSIYGHSSPRDDIVPGKILNDSEIIGMIAPSNSRTVRSHLHISMAWVDLSIAPDELSWETIGNNEKIRLIDPLEYIGLPYAVVETFD